MRYACILDTETTGLDPKTDEVIEVGCILYDLHEAAPVCSYANVIRRSEARNPAYDVNRISLKMLESGEDEGVVWDSIRRMVHVADALLAHRAEFDRSFCPQDFQKSAKWCCTKFHVDWPYGKPGDSLVQLALAHGVGVLTAHRALTDCDTLSRLMTRVHEMLVTKEEPYPLVSLLKKSMRPRVKIQALVSYDDRELAKQAGFGWDASSKMWTKEVVAEDAPQFPFQTRQL